MGARKGGVRRAPTPPHAIGSGQRCGALAPGPFANRPGRCAGKVQRSRGFFGRIVQVLELRDLDGVGIFFAEYIVGNF